MRLLLPPSETKRTGGDGAALDLATLFGDRLTAERRRTMRDLAALSRDRDRALRALHLSERAAGLLEANRRLGRAPTMAALDRYDGVLYDGLGVATLSAEARLRAERMVLIQSALFGPVAGGDRIPEHRLSASTSLGGPSLRERWRVAARSWPADELLLDLRSEDYRALTPAPTAVVVEVVSEDSDGARRALNHWNKHAKGLLTRAIVDAGDGVESVDALLAWARDAGIRLSPGAPGRLLLVADDPRSDGDGVVASPPG